MRLASPDSGLGQDRARRKGRPVGVTAAAAPSEASLVFRLF